MDSSYIPEVTTIRVDNELVLSYLCGGSLLASPEIVVLATGGLVLF